MKRARVPDSASLDRAAAARRTRLGDRRDVLRRRAAAAADDVDEAAVGELARGSRPVSGGCSSYCAERVRQAGVRIAADVAGRRSRASSARYGRMSRAPSAQLMPTLNGRACAIEVQNASIVWPDSVRPLRSVIVTEIISGSADAASPRTPRRWRRARPWRSACRRSSRAAARRTPPSISPRDLLV